MPDKQICEVSIFDQMEYQEAWSLQERLADEIGRGLRPPHLLLLQHPPTYTFGRRGKIEHLLWGKEELSQRGIQVHWVDRGGDVTYHGPGQLVGYPLLRLNPIVTGNNSAEGQLPQADYHGYLRKLEVMLIQTLRELGFSPHTVPGVTGVFVELPGNVPTEKPISAKIASIGIKVDARGVTRHGFALNVKPIMEHWEGIIACGLATTPVTSLAALSDTPPEMGAVQECVIHSFSNVFNFEIK